MTDESKRKLKLWLQKDSQKRNGNLQTRKQLIKKCLPHLSCIDFAGKEFYQAKNQKLMQTKIKKVELRNLQIEDYKELKKSMKMAYPEFGRFLLERARH